ncbi:RNA polymerase sigma factor [Deminuibacter soli]|uniref:RNA polymerase sigma factor n=1 Tax=Deminuibacter soli TaxID=2291815 RepID=A0A3E1NPJ7_9BACT|nr:RNA polymerase sigma factor [Deminuibacter soli]RFM29852.1 RNA polymerase sigma factor [Deminuibacter soli]
MHNAISISDQVAEQSKRNITQVIEAYSKRLFGFIRRRVATQADAEDILQDVFYQFADRVDDVDQVANWLFTVARNKITDGKRKHKPSLLDDVFGTEGAENDQLDWTELLFDEADNPETSYLRGVFWDILYQSLDELPEEQKQVFVLHEMEGLSFKEIAAQTGELVNTLISRKRYAVLYLRQKLEVVRNELLNY